jgi:hypothetical protein
MNNLYVPQSVKVKVNLQPIDFGPNYEKKIRDRVIEQYGDRCYINGFIKKSSIEILKIENGRREGSHLHGFLTFVVEFSALFCIPKQDTLIHCHVVKVNKFGIMAQAYPIDIIVPRQLQSLPGNDIDKLKNLRGGEMIYVKTLQYTIENNRLIVVGFITDISQDKPNTVELPNDGFEMPYHVHLVYGDQKPIPSERLGTGDKIIQLKEKIIPYKKLWGLIESMITPYQLIDRYLSTATNYIQYNQFTAVYDPYSLYPVFDQSYFKLWELLVDVGVLDKFINQPLKMATLNEGPNGFIQCLLDFRNRQHSREWKDDTYYMVAPKGDSVEEKKYLEMMMSNGYQINQSSGTSLQVGDDKCHLITADGGVDLNDNSTHELGNAKLFYTEILMALTNQDEGGVLIIKIYDIYYDLTLQLIYLLSAYYNHMVLIKPHTSRPTNSEKYVVCSDFRGIEQEQLDQLSQLMTQWTQLGTVHISHVLDVKQLPDSQMIHNIIGFNRYNTELQMDTINEGLELIDGQYRNAGVKDEYLTEQKLTLKKWCDKYGLPYVK